MEASKPPTTSRPSEAFPARGRTQRAKTVSLIPAQLDTLAANSVESVREGPLWLFLRDCSTFFCSLKYFLTIFLPFKTNDPSDEFYLWNRNLVGLAVLTVGSILELILIAAAIPAMLLLPGFFGLLILVGGTTLVRLIFLVVQGPLCAWSEKPVDADTLAKQREFSTERWMFLNGCCVTGDMLQQNLNVISKTFGRQVFAVYNRTYGLVGDVLECIIQRSFRFYTQETRCAYQYVKSYCADPLVTKVVLIGHSQGGIMTSEILDQLYQDLPSECVAKMEVYTFGNAAIHFNNPLRKLAITNTNSAKTATVFSPTSLYSPRATQNGNDRMSSLITNTPVSPDGPLGPIVGVPTPEPDRVIPYIEHYCNEKDMVTRWGVLHSVKDIMNNTFCGQVFVSRGTSGHMLNQHYLSKMFPISQPSTNERVKRENGTLPVPFLDSVVEVDTKTAERHKQDTKKQLGILRVNSMPHDASVAPGSPAEIAMTAAAKRQATLELQMGDAEIVRDADLAGVEANRLNIVKTGERLSSGRTVRDLSRLWRYMGGGSPGSGEPGFA